MVNLTLLMESNPLDVNNMILPPLHKLIAFNPWYDWYVAMLNEFTMIYFFVGSNLKDLI